MRAIQLTSMIDFRHLCRTVRQRRRSDGDEASLEQRGGGRRASILGAGSGATSQSGRKPDGYAGSQPRWAGTDTLQHGRTSSGAHTIGPDARRRQGDIGGTDSPYYARAAAFDLRYNVGDAPDAPSRARPPRDAWHDGPWPEIGDGYGRTAEPSRARPPAAGCSPDGPASSADARGEQHGNAWVEHGRPRPDAIQFQHPNGNNRGRGALQAVVLRRAEDAAMFLAGLSGLEPSFGDAANLLVPVARSATGGPDVPPADAAALARWEQHGGVWSGHGRPGPDALLQRWCFATLPR